MPSEPVPTVRETTRPTNADKMTRLLSILGFEQWSTTRVQYEKDGRIEMILPTDYLDRAGPMASLMINSFLETPTDDEEYPESFEDMQAVMASYLGLVQDDQGEWVRPDVQP